MNKKSFCARLICVFCAALTMGALWPASEAAAFCGMYVSGASDKLYNDATQVVMMRDGTKTVLSMRNTYQGPPKDFAMVVPVPVVLQKENVKTLQDTLFQKVDTLAAPRLVEYWEQDPCPQPRRYFDRVPARPSKSVAMADEAAARPSPKVPAVKIEAQFKEGEYEIVILSATESNALETWLLQNKYNIPKGSASVLQGYVQKGMYFFVAKVDSDKVKFDKSGQAMLSPLRFHYDTDDFSLPVRLGLINARGKQDLLVHILAQNQRYEVANTKNVTIPTNLIVDKSVKSSFAPFYASLFDYTMEENPGAVVTEYAWQAGKCDPCPTGNFGNAQLGGPLDYHDLQMLGLEVVSPAKKQYIQGFSQNIKVSSGQEPPNFHKLRQEIAVQAQRCAYEHFDSSNYQYVNVLLQFGVKADDRKLAPTVNNQGGQGPSEAISQCIKDRLEGFSARGISKIVGGTDFSVWSQLSLTSQVQVENQWQMTQNWVLTRLHARYDAKTLKDDLVFKAADAIVGGRGTPVGVKGELSEQGAQKSSMNNFQARYAILHPWTGKMSCASPSRGQWGYPPNGNWNVSPALDLAATPRNKVKLSSAIKSKDAPGLPWSKKP